MQTGHDSRLGSVIGARRSVLQLGLALALGGCGASAQSGTELDAEPQTEPDAEPQTEPDAMIPYRECVGVVGSTGTLDTDVQDQRDLDALAGCSTIVGSLTIQPFEGADLRPLASLRSVQGTVTLGSLYDEPPPNGFSSLEGLENLESVASLSLRGVLAPSLRALGGLTRFVPFADETFSPMVGHVFLDHCPELTDLSGLERLEGLTTLTVQNNAKLTSLRGIRIPELMGSLTVSDSPVDDLGDISRLTEVSGALWFHHTAIRSAAGLERVARVDQLQFCENPALTDLSALGALTTVRSLSVSENPQLAMLPAFDGLQRLTSLGVTDNDLLREIPSMPGVGSLREAGFIERNASLERVFAGSELIEAYQLRVADNPNLSVLDLDRLERVTDLWVTNNPALDDTAIRGLERIENAHVRIAGNLGQMLPLADCPWTGDGTCDDVQHPYGVCAEGTDPDCVLPEE
jgi:hypothetical protein